MAVTQQHQSIITAGTSYYAIKNIYNTKHSEPTEAMCKGIYIYIYEGPTVCHQKLGKLHVA